MREKKKFKSNSFHLFTHHQKKIVFIMTSNNNVIGQKKNFWITKKMKKNYRLTFIEMKKKIPYPPNRHGYVEIEPKIT